MSAQALPRSTVPAEFDLRDRRNWKPSVDEMGRHVPRVVMSLCGRYTIVQLSAYSENTAGYQAFRRRGLPEQPRWDPPTWCEVYATPEDARQGCSAHRKQELTK